MSLSNTILSGAITRAIAEYAHIISEVAKGKTTRNDCHGLVGKAIKSGKLPKGSEVLLLGDTKNIVAPIEHSIIVLKDEILVDNWDPDGILTNDIYTNKSHIHYVDEPYLSVLKRIPVEDLL